MKDSDVLSNHKLQFCPAVSIFNVKTVKITQNFKMPEFFFNLDFF